MVKLQKTDNQQRRLSQQASSSGRAVPASAIKVTSHQHKSAVSMLASNPCQSGQTTPPSSWNGGSIQQVSSQPKKFEHSPTPPEPSFVAIGREQFLKRANIIAQTKVKRAQSTSPAATFRQAVTPARSVSPSIPSRNPRRLSLTRQKAQPTKLFGLAGGSDIASAQVLVNLKPGSVPSTPCLSVSTDRTPAPYVHKKRSMSLPTLAGRQGGGTSSTKVSFTPVPSVHTFHPDDATSTTSHLPFAPRIDLESMFDNVSASYNERLAEAQKRSSALWKKNFSSQREENREAGVLRKRRTRRVSSPVLEKPSSFAMPYQETKAGTMPQIIRAVPDKTSLKAPATDEKTTPGLDLSNSSLIHPAFRPARKSLQMKDFNMENNVGIVLPKYMTPASGVCSHCGHSQQLPDTPPLTPSSIPDHSTEISPAVELEAITPGLDTRFSSFPTSNELRNDPHAPEEVNNAERVTPGRANILAASSQESVHSSKTFVDVSNTEKIPLCEIRNRSEGDFGAATRRDGWPLRMTNWKGPFAAQAQRSLHELETFTVQSSNSKTDENGSDISLLESCFDGSLLTPQPRKSNLERGRSLRRLVIGREDRTDQYRSEQDRQADAPRLHEIDVVDRECRSPSIYSTDIPSPLSISLDGNNESTNFELLPESSFVSDGDDPVVSSNRVLPLTTRRGTLTMSPSIVCNSAEQDISAVDYRPVSTNPFRSTAEEQEPTQYSLNISRSKQRSDRSSVHSKEKFLAVETLKNDADVRLQSNTRHEKNCSIATSVRSPTGAQTLNQFKNNCRPIEEPPTPIDPRSSAAGASFGASEQQHPLRRKAQIGQGSGRKRLSKTRPESQVEIYVLQDPEPSKQSNIDANQQNLTKETRQRRQQAKRPDIPLRTRAITSIDTSSAQSEPIEERRSRSRMPPNSFPTKKNDASEQGRSRSRSRSRIRSMLQTIGLASKTDDV